MAVILADIASGHSDWADLLFLVALVLFLGAAALAWTARPVWAAACALGLASTALGFLLL